mmetsp:Transcript_4467/g.11046  ORF Transcript_4467/g.11046 Transcript_4467/m.11046 type:complete len:91 (-) Transcript_4467:24-296(-)
MPPPVAACARLGAPAAHREAGGAGERAAQADADPDAAGLHTLLPELVAHVVEFLPPWEQLACRLACHAGRGGHPMGAHLPKGRAQDEGCS